jgi:putative MFS transporter
VSTTPGGTRLTSYQRRLMLFLSVATFFEGFDFFAFTQILPSLRADFALGAWGAGALVAAINVGPILAYFLVRRADRVGRKPILSLTIAGYTIFTLLSGLAPNVWLFAAFQLAARVFLIGEWAIAMVFAAEEFPAAKRGLIIGVIQAFSSLGSVVCAGVVPLLLKLPTGWRSVFFVGAVPLVVIALARRGIRETTRFTETVRSADTPSLFRIWRTPWRGRVVLLAAIWALTYVCTTTGILFWKDFAVNERGFWMAGQPGLLHWLGLGDLGGMALPGWRGWTDAEVGAAVTIGAVAGMPLVFMVGPMLDRVGRRLGSIVIFLAAGGSIVLAYNLVTPAALTAALALGIFGASAVLPVLNAYTAELFPTEIRSDAFAWANNLLGRIGAVAAPLVVGAIAADTGWGLAVSVTAVGPVLALVLILATLPETRGRELEDTSALGH